MRRTHPVLSRSGVAGWVSTCPGRGVAWRGRRSSGVDGRGGSRPLWTAEQGEGQPVAASWGPAGWLAELGRFRPPPVTDMTLSVRKKAESTPGTISREGAGGRCHGNLGPPTQPPHQEDPFAKFVGCGGPGLPVPLLPFSWSPTATQGGRATCLRVAQQEMGGELI